MRFLGFIPIFLVSLFVGCVAPQPHLWKNGGTEVPASFEVKAPLTFTDGKTHESFSIPPGTYRLWYQNKFSYYYRAEGTKIRRTDANGTVSEFLGGLDLAKRVDIVGVYQLITTADDYKKNGELTHLAALEAGDKDGQVRRWIVNLPREFYPALGFPQYQMPGTDR